MEKELNNLIVSILEDNAGLVFIAIKQRAKFEGWLKFQLAHKLLEEDGKVEVERPYPTNGKLHADIYAKNAFIELKTPNTNYRYKQCISCNRPVTKNITSIIEDINKLRSIEDNEKYIAFVIFPIDQDKKYREYILRIENEGRVKLFEKTIKINDIPLSVCTAKVE
jgi:hypothetical protein